MAISECQRDSDLDQILKRESIKYSWTLKGSGGARGSYCMSRLCVSPVLVPCLWNIHVWVPRYGVHTQHVCLHVCVIKPRSSENTLTEGCFLLVRVGDRQVWARGAAAISEWSALQWKHTSAGWYSSQVALALQTCLILQTQLVFSYSLFSILLCVSFNLCRSSTVSLFFLLFFFSNPLCKYIFYSASSSFYCHIHFPFLSSCMLKFTRVPELSHWGKIPQGWHGILQCLCGQLKTLRNFVFLEKSIVLLCALFLYLFGVLHPAGVGNANSVRVLEGKGAFICIYLHPINTSNLLTWKGCLD